MTSDAQAHESPDVHGLGLTKGPLDPLRYDGHTDDPHESAGMLRALMPERVRVLDVGCGTGSVTAIANQGKHNEVFALEPDVHRAAIAKSRGINAICGFFDDEFAQQQGLFDVIVFADVLEHLANPSDMLRVATDALKPGGFILVSVPNIAHWSVRLKLLFGRFDYEETGICDSTHLCWFTQKSIRDLFRRQNLDIVSLQHSSGVNLPVYNSGLLRYSPRNLRQQTIRMMTGIFPKLFACQFIVKARKPI